MLRTRLYGDPREHFVHDVVLASCDRFLGKTVLIDSSCDRRISYADYGELISVLPLCDVSLGREIDLAIARSRRT